VLCLRKAHGAALQRQLFLTVAHGRFGWQGRAGKVPRSLREKDGGCWNIPGDPARDAIAASDGLEGRATEGAAEFLGMKTGGR